MSEVVEKILEKFEKEICVQTLLYEKKSIFNKKSEVQKERPIDILRYSENLENKLKVVG